MDIARHPRALGGRGQRRRLIGVLPQARMRFRQLRQQPFGPPLAVLGPHRQRPESHGEHHPDREHHELGRPRGAGAVVCVQRDGGGHHAEDRRRHPDRGPAAQRHKGFERQQHEQDLGIARNVGRGRHREHHGMPADRPHRHDPPGPPRLRRGGHTRRSGSNRRAG
ncbi:hypothetical protein ACFXG4_24710 [Nocardia sp. NPDC059246]|uniref:hypothetical protein n=1 Tax=Nocardia sp. NPDC059246 TaxID=3346789 RepID=UPI0036CBB5C8